MMGLLDRLRLPEAKTIADLDDPATAVLHARIIQKKPLLRALYLDFYSAFKRVMDAFGPGTYVELGSGGGFLKDVLPEVITSDVRALPTVDQCFDAEAMPFDAGSVDGFFMLNVFHHFTRPGNVLREFSRTLRPGRSVVMIEPANTLWARWVYRRFHHEPFDLAGGWGFVSSGPLSGANGALPWIVFVRDRVRFEREFPLLRVRRVVCHTPLRYLASGGVSFRQLAPSWSGGILKAVEWALSPLDETLGMFMTIELARRSDGRGQATLT